MVPGCSLDTRQPPVPLSTTVQRLCEDAEGMTRAAEDKTRFLRSMRWVPWWGFCNVPTT